MNSLFWLLIYALHVFLLLFYQVDVVTLECVVCLTVGECVVCPLHSPRTSSCNFSEAASNDLEWDDLDEDGVYSRLW